jgi:hypothetical protein
MREPVGQECFYTPDHTPFGLAEGRWVEGGARKQAGERRKGRKEDGKELS